MTVEENICVVPQLLGWDMGKARTRAAELVEMMALEPGVFLKRYPKELSGGQAQRIGVARALAADPPVMLMDEPFGAIDPINREIIQDEFLKMQATLGKTVMFVSHDIDEAVKMGDRIAIFREGRLEQFAAPDDILAHPANAFIADFVGGDRALKRLRLVLVRDAMDADAPKVRAEDTLATAAALMREHEHRAIVMVGPRGRARGTISLAEAEAGPDSARVGRAPAGPGRDGPRRGGPAHGGLDDVHPRSRLARLRRRRRLLPGADHAAGHHPHPRRDLPAPLGRG